MVSFNVKSRVVLMTETSRSLDHEEWVKHDRGSHARSSCETSVKTSVLNCLADVRWANI
ncbi:MAG: hypothetical protein HW412_1470, partial [Bacteroidetes bacterium]|nr:hypothetical protein [Bacteroidota bacterium]